MSEVNLFAWATKNKIRFETSRGSLTVEDIWTLPLTSRNGLSLDTVAKELYRTVKEFDDISFVQESTKESTTAQHKLDIVKHIINERMEENRKKREREQNKEKNEQIRQLLQEKELEGLRNMSPEELRAMLKE